jgi:SAM-dependent methyltransferase
MKMQHWSEISRNPVSRSVLEFQLAKISGIRVNKQLGSWDCIRNFVESQSTLDIGVVEHDLDHVSSKSWKHKFVKEHSKSVVGIDILEKEVDYLNAKGYDVRLVDATSDANLDERFDRVLIGDVIEHVNDPSKLLEFSARHLNDDGLIGVSTPNPFFYSYILKAMRFGTFIPNADHVSWISPTMALELGYRSGLELVRYFHIGGYPQNRLRRYLLKIAHLFFSKDSEFFSYGFFYVYKKPGSAHTKSLQSI